MTGALDRIKANVAKVAEADEKARWQANIDLWTSLIEHKGALGKADIEKVKIPFEKMTANITRITELGERERWQTNQRMWKVVMGQAIADK